MNWDAIGAVGEVLGAVAVVATLGYLAVQIKLNTRTASASVTEAAGNRSVEIAKMVAADPDLSRIVMAALYGKAGLEEIDAFRLTMVFHAVMRSYEITIAHREGDLLEETSYTGLRDNLRIWVGSPYFHAWWAGVKTVFSPALQDLVESAINHPMKYPKAELSAEDYQFK